MQVFRHGSLRRILIGNMSGNNQRKKLSCDESARIWQMKAWAIIMVICAHCSDVSLDAPMVSLLISRLLQTLGSLGVPVFFFLAGYVFRYKKLKPWLKAKAIGLLIPWITCGILVYLYVHLRKGGLSALSLIRWLVGDGTYLWYLSVMVLLLFWARGVFFGVQKGFWTLPVASVFSVFLSAVALALEHFEILMFHPYLNVFRWLWLFMLGILAGHVSLLEKAGSHMLLALVWILALTVLSALGVCITYWSWAFPLCACLTVAVFMNSYGFPESVAAYMQTLGEDSFAVYLLHMPVAGVVANLCNRVSDVSGLLTLSRPLVVLIITHGCIFLLKRAGKRIHLEKTVRMLLGLR